MKSILKILKEEQKEQGYLRCRDLRSLAERENLNLSQVFDVASFYSFIYLKKKGKNKILVCKGIPCYLKGEENILEILEKMLNIKAGEITSDEKFSIELTNCIGCCDVAPAIMINDNVFWKFNRGKIEKDFGEILNMPEEKIVLKNCGNVSPLDINSYIKVGGFLALKKAREMGAENIIEEIKKSNLRGRGGAGFPTGIKWELCSKSVNGERLAVNENRKPITDNLAYIICNADEGEPGTFKDKFIIQNDPFSLIEGIIIASLAISAKKAFIYLREEYHYLLNNLINVIEQIKNKGFLENLDIEIIEGAGAYVCGEESALMESIEGKRGDVRYRPPFPPQRGLYQLPTIINNVETLMNIPSIILHGAEWFCKIGTERSKGTKVFSISGDVKKPGVFELVMGSKLSELLNLAETENIKFVQVGGASGKIVPKDLIDTVLSFETILGAGAVIVFNERRNVIDIVERTLDFFLEESCGKCTPCREGTKILHSVMKKFKNKSAKKNDINILEDISNTMMLTSLCGLGQASPNVVIDTIKYFRNEYEERIL